MAPAQKSIVWVFFKKSSDNKFATCSLCNQQLKYFVSTSNLKQHIIRKHIIQYNEELRKEKPGDAENTEESELQVIEAEAVAGTSSQTENEPAPVFKLPQTQTNINKSSLKRSANSDLESSQVPKLSKRGRQLKLYGGRNTDELTESQKDDIDLSLVKMIVIDYQPLSIVEDRGFLEYSNKIKHLV